MNKHKYYLVYDENELVSSFDAPEDNKHIQVLLSVCKVEDLTVKDVSEFEYRRQTQLAKEDLIY